MTRPLAKFCAITIAIVSLVCCTTEASHAEPLEQFPDLTRLTPVRAQELYKPLRSGSSYEFLTPSNIYCRITLGSIGCSGDIPGIPVSTPHTTTGTDCALIAAEVGQNLNTGPYTFQRHGGNCATIDYQHTHRLNNGQKAQLYLMQPVTVTCGVDQPARLACKDTNNHGFVIDPAGSWTF